ncbi:MAG: hypothetical protein U0169_17775 [Polyangiaceae bacterium]
MTRRFEAPVPRRTRPTKVLFLLFLLALAACTSGGGCASGCNGVTPLPHGFPKALVVEKAGAARVTRPGLDFLGDNLGKVSRSLLGSQTGVLDFEIPKSQTSTSFGITFTINICPNGPNRTSTPPQCLAQIAVGNAHLHMDGVTPRSVRISGTVPVRLQDLPVNVSVVGDIRVGAGTGSCNAGTPVYDYKDVPVDVVVPVVTEGTSPRDGYTKLDVKNATITLGLVSDDVGVCKDCGSFPFAQSVCDGVLGFIKNQVFSTLVDGVTNQIKSALESQLCTKPSPTLDPPCPDGSTPNDPDTTKATQCVYTGRPDTCVPVMFGTDGHLALGGFLQNFAPGNSGALDFVVAAGGDLDPAPGQGADNVGYPGHTPNGLTLSLLGGVAAAPPNDCVAPVPNPPPTGIPTPEDLRLDRPSGFPASEPTPHVGFGLSGAFLNYSLTEAYNSGLLCLGLTTDRLPLINSGLLSSLLPSIRPLTLEQKSAAVALVAHPTKGPKLSFGGGTDVRKDPLLRVDLEGFSVDVLLYSYDRFIRILTFSGDLRVPVNLQTGKDPKTNPNGGILPVLGDLSIANAKVTNADLLVEDPALVAPALASVVSGLSSQLIGSIPALDISGALTSVGMRLTIGPNGIRKLTQGDHEFLGVFANIELAPTQMKVVDANVRLGDKSVDARALAIPTFDRSRLPRVTLDLGASDVSTDDVEFAVAVDGAPRSAWSKGTHRVVTDDSFALQGKHAIRVFARHENAPDSEGAAADVAFRIDTLPPSVSVVVDAERGVAKIDAHDFVSDDEDLLVRYRARARDAADFGPFGAWNSLAGTATVDSETTSEIDVEVRDEEGNIGTLRQPLVRGRPDRTLSTVTGCSCRAGTSAARGEHDVASGIALVLLGAFAFARLARPRGTHAATSPTARGPRSLLLPMAALGALAALNPGCGCGDDGDVDASTPPGCGSDCKQACQPGLEMGVVGGYTSVARAKDGTVWVAGYNDSVYGGGTSYFYGDLVAGTYDLGKKKVAWQTVDGLPAPRTDGTCPDFDRAGWRGGEVDPGDTVGLYTSMILDVNDRPQVSYYDKTHGALKFASWNGSAWNVHAVTASPGGDHGRFARMLSVDGKPVVAYLAMERSSAGKLKSRIMVARALLPVPAKPSDWRLEDVLVDETSPCRPSLCNGDEACVVETGTCTKITTACTAPCGTNTCVETAGGPACKETLAITAVEGYTNAVGTYLGFAAGPSGLGIVAYDRVHGNLLGSAETKTGWDTKILAGEVGSRADTTAKDTGDVGLAASLAIGSAGEWHVSFVDGIDEALRYLTVKAGTIGTPELVDDGAKLDGRVFADGKHFVGDDGFIRVEDGGAVRIFYQDATAGTLRVATGTPDASGKHTWVLAAVAQPERFAGFFPRPVPGTRDVSNFFRHTDRATKTLSGDIAIVTP